MSTDLLIRNGHVIDPERNIDRVMDIAISRRRIVPVPERDFTPERTIDASGCLVLPGLVDFHTHIYHDGGLTPVKPDLLLATGVTCAIDAGTCGCGNFDAFYKTSIVHSHACIRAWLNVSSAGLADEHLPENFDPARFNLSGILDIFERYPDHILGLKIRMGQEMVDSLAPLAGAIRLAEDLAHALPGRSLVPVCVHATNPPCECDTLIDMLRQGDVFCHVYHGRGSSILNEAGQVRDSVRRARERGVIMDIANGRGNFSHDVALAALEQGFTPDVISSDIGLDKLYLSSHARSLPFVMSKLLCMGMQLGDIVRATTATPARLAGLSGRHGTLAPGARADVALFRLETRTVRFLDSASSIYTGDRLLIPQLTLCNGEPVFAQADFNI